METLVRVDPLAGAPALDACLVEGELASSPVEKALGVLWSWPLWVSRALSVISTRLCHGQRVEKINNNHDQRTCCDCQLLGGGWPPPFGGDLERVDPLADASVAHLLFQEVKTASSLVVPMFGGLLSHRDEPDVGASSVCQMHDGRLMRNSGYSRFDSSLGEVRKVMPFASDGPGSLFGELVNLTRDSRHRSYLAHELLLTP